MKREHYFFLITMLCFVFCYYNFILKGELKEYQNSKVVIINPSQKVEPVFVEDELVCRIILEGIVRKASEIYGVDENLIKAIIDAESKWDIFAESKKGAKGLMQLMPKTAEYIGVKNIFDPEENIFGGTRYLRYLMDRFDGNIELVIAAYNSGPTRVAKLNRVPRIGQTILYLNKVLNMYNFYRSEQEKIDV